MPVRTLVQEIDTRYLDGANRAAAELDRKTNEFEAKARTPILSVSDAFSPIDDSGRTYMTRAIVY